MFRRILLLFLVLAVIFLALIIAPAHHMATLSVPGKYRTCHTTYYHVPAFKTIGTLIGPLIHPDHWTIWASTLPSDLTGDTLIITWKPDTTTLLRHEFGHAIQVCNKGPKKFYLNYYLRPEFQLAQEEDAVAYSRSIQAAVYVNIRYMLAFTLP